MTTNILIGGAGLIGTTLAGMLAQENSQTIIVDSFRSSEHLEYWRKPAYDWRMQRASKLATIIRTDVRDTLGLSQIVREYKPDTIYYLAALLASESNTHPKEAQEVQVQALTELVSLLEGTKHHYTFVFASSSYIYGNFVEFPASEQHPLQPLDVYGCLKLEAEQWIQNFSWQWGQWTILRPSSVYGIGDPRRRYATVAIEQAVTGKDVELTYPDFVCDFTYVKDVSKAFALAGSEHFVPSTIFNATYGKSYTNADFVRTLQSLVPSIRIVKPETPSINVPLRGALNCHLIRKHLGWQPQYDLQDGIRDAILEAQQAYQNIGGLLS